MTQQVGGAVGISASSSRIPAQRGEPAPGAELRPGQLALRGLVKSYDGARAVDGLDLDIAAGEFFSLLGASGCGKTTTLRMLAGFETPDHGTIRLDGADLVAVPPHRRPVNTVFQSYALFGFLSVADNVAFGLRYTSADKHETRRRVAAALELVEMSSYANRRPHQLSGGQQQRVALARALILEPTVLLLDEPLGALDAKLRRALQTELRALQRRVGTTFVYVTHDQEEALTMSDRLAILVAGRVEQVGTPSEMYAAPATAYVAGFLGSANLVEGAVTAVDGDTVTCALDGGLVLRAARTADGPGTPGSRVTLVLRPERVEVGPAEDLVAGASGGATVGATGSTGSTGSTGDANVFPARVETLVFLGGHTHVTVRAAGCTLVAQVANVHGELPDWLHEGREVCTRVSHRAAQLLPTRTSG